MGTEHRKLQPAQAEFVCGGHILGRQHHLAGVRAAAAERPGQGAAHGGGQSFPIGLGIAAAGQGETLTAGPGGAAPHRAGGRLFPGAGQQRIGLGEIGAAEFHRVALCAVAVKTVDARSRDHIGRHAGLTPGRCRLGGIGGRDPGAERPQRLGADATGERGEMLQHFRRSGCRDKEQVEPRVFHPQQVSPVRPLGSADAMDGAPARMNEQAPTPWAPQERHVLGRTVGGNAGIGMIGRDHELAAPVERPELLAQPMDGRAGVEREAEPPALRIARQRRETRAFERGEDGLVADDQAKPQGIDGKFQRQPIALKPPAGFNGFDGSALGRSRLDQQPGIGAGAKRQPDDAGAMAGERQWPGLGDQRTVRPGLGRAQRCGSGGGIVDLETHGRPLASPSGAADRRWPNYTPVGLGRACCVRPPAPLCSRPRRKSPSAGAPQ